MNLLDQGAFDFLKHDAQVRGATFHGKGTTLHISTDLSFIPEPMSIVKNIRADLKVIAYLIESTANAMFDSCSSDQLTKIVNEHPVELMRPLYETEWVRITSIEKSYGFNKWVFYYHDGENSSEISEFNIDDLLSVLETAEKVMFNSKQNTIKT